MKRPVIAIAILIVTSCIAITSLLYVRKACNEGIVTLEETLDNAIKENKQGVTRGVTQTTEHWEKKKPLLNLLIGQKNTNEVSASLNKLTYFSKINDYDSVIMHAEDCKEIFVRIRESNEPNLSTIF